MTNVEATGSETVIDDMLAMMRSHLGMDVAYIGEFVADEVLFRAVDAPDHPEVGPKGARRPLSEASCLPVFEGKVRRLIPDCAQDPVASEMAVFRNLPVGAQLAVPIGRSDGTPFGMVTFLATDARPELGAKDQRLIEMFANLIERELLRRIKAEAAHEARRKIIGDLIAANAFEVFAQPIIELSTNTISGYEALCRFAAFPEIPAAEIFEMAGSVGLRAQLEAHVIRAALQGAVHLSDGRYLSVNASPMTVFSPEFTELFDGCDLRKVILEMTEHQEIRDYPGLLSLLAPLRNQGLRLAVDDAGTGFSGLHQIVQLKPDMIKLDRALVSGIDGDQAKRAMCAAMVHYAGESGAFLIAEGVETAAEAAELIRLGVSHAQGFHFGRPLPLPKLSAA